MDGREHAGYKTEGYRGAGLMVSDFIEERDGFLALPDEMYATLSKEDSSLKQAAQVVFEYGKAKEGYWGNDLLMEQMEVAVQVGTLLAFTNMYGFSTTHVDTWHLLLMLW